MPFSPPRASAQYKQIIVATGSPFELGLIDALAKVFEEETGCVVRCIKTPTGPGLELGRHGFTHITMGHHPAATKKFVQDGYAAKRTDLMYNLTIIVGPKGDPAGIRGISDLAGALAYITGARTDFGAVSSRGDLVLLPEDMKKIIFIDKKTGKKVELSPRFNPHDIFAALFQKVRKDPSFAPDVQKELNAAVQAYIHGPVGHLFQVRPETG